MFRVGQRVVCVDAEPASGRVWFGYAPTEGAVYTVTGFGESRYGDYPVITIAEIEHPWGYRASRFRPVAERKTDIGVFHEILKRNSAPARRVRALSHSR